LTPVFSPDGTIVAVGNRNSTTCLFDVATGRLLYRLPWQSTHELKFDPAGKRLAVAYVDGNLAVWSVETGDLLQRARARAEELYSLDWSPDGKIIATSGRDASVALWKAANLTLLHEVDGPEWIICVRFNPQGTRLIFAGGSRTPNGDRYVELLGVPRD
jgi:WD40 repeat protein